MTSDRYLRRADGSIYGVGPRPTIEFEGTTYEAWPEHGCWYEVGHVDEVGYLYRPMNLDGTPDLDSLCGEIEVKYADA